jgi:hypothetical protein
MLFSYCSTTDRAPGDILLQIPVEEMITNNNVLSLKQQPQQSSLWTEEQRLAIALLWKKTRESNPYVMSVLPKEHFSFWTLPSDLWNEMMLPRCYRESFQATRSMILEFGTSLLQQDSKDTNYSLEDTLWAFSMVRSRSIAVPEFQSEDTSTLPLALIPGLDLFNHVFDAGTLLQLESSPPPGNPNRHWTLTSSKSYTAGDQIFLSYGDDKDNWKLLLTYGFAVPSNPNSLVFWTWEDLLDAAGHVRPSVFPERVRKQLFQHPQLYEVYSKPSENRASFSYNAKTQTQRESLQTGLQMLDNLAVQLGHDGDTTLSKDVLRQLIMNRLEDVKNSIHSITLMTVPLEWKSFVQSVLLALQEEESYLSKIDTTMAF